MIKIIYRNKHQGFIELNNLDEISDIIADKANLLWLDLDSPDLDELNKVAFEFDFHPLAIEDAAMAHVRPKVNEYQNYYFVVFYSILFESKLSQINLREISMFLGENYLVTVHTQAIPELTEAKNRWEKNLQEIERGIGVLLYSLIDTLVDNYFPVVDTLSDMIEDLEEDLFAAKSKTVISSLLKIKRNLIQMRRVVAPERDVLNVLLRRENPIFSQRTLEYFQDIYDHIIRITDAIDNYRDLLSSTLDANLSVVSNDLNKVMRTMTAASIILMTDSLLAGIYGMNFENMPELRMEYGYFGLIFVMAAISSSLLYFFKKRGWF